PVKGAGSEFISETEGFAILIVPHRWRSGSSGISFPGASAPGYPYFASLRLSVFCILQNKTVIPSDPANA
ncbi:MAG TPA: hypothetical protein PLD62_06610, partial [Candidatus Cloacimonadota bacterium]|nr:hypothetical protein [Candidatus Cloacimonadota bacterium]